MASRRHRSPSAPPLDDDDLLCEIFLRLPPQPSSLPRASAVCKRWRRLLSDPRFLRRFRRHHRRSPPLLGCFVNEFHGLAFVPTMEFPNRIPRGRFSLQLGQGGRFLSMGCRHGLVLLSDQTRRQFIVWDPVTGEHQQLAIPPGFGPKMTEIRGAVLRAADGFHFQVVFVAMGSDVTQHGQRAIARVYLSEAGEWSNLLSAPIPNPSQTQILNGLGMVLFWTRVSAMPPVLVGNFLYWNLINFSPSILEFDLEKQSLAVLQVPLDVLDDNFTAIRADGGGLGLLYVSNLTAKLWERKTDCHGVASWMLDRTVELDKLFFLDSEKKREFRDIMLLGFAEENNAVFLRTFMGHLEVQLPSLQFKILSNTSITSQCHPFEAVYTAETGIGGGHGAIDLLLNI